MASAYAAYNKNCCRISRFQAAARFPSTAKGTCHTVTGSTNQVLKGTGVRFTRNVRSINFRRQYVSIILAGFIEPQHQRWSHDIQLRKYMLFIFQVYYYLRINIRLRRAAHKHNRQILTSQNNFAKELYARGHSKIVYKLRVNPESRNHAILNPPTPLSKIPLFIISNHLFAFLPSAKKQWMEKIENKLRN